MNEQFEKNLAGKLGRSTFYVKPQEAVDLTEEQGRELTNESFLALEDVNAIQEVEVPQNARPSR